MIAPTYQLRVFVGVQEVYTATCPVELRPPTVGQNIDGKWLVLEVEHKPNSGNFDLPPSNGEVWVSVTSLEASAHNAAVTWQPVPGGDGVDVGSKAAQRLRGAGFVAIADDLESRIAFGAKKYGQRLKTNNGRNALFDSYQEVLDFLNYLMQGVLEGHAECDSLFVRAMPLAFEVYELLNGRNADLQKV
jgi:hypothetical protein